MSFSKENWTCNDGKTTCIITFYLHLLCISFNGELSRILLKVGISCLQCTHLFIGIWLTVANKNQLFSRSIHPQCADLKWTCRGCSCCAKTQFGPLWIEYIGYDSHLIVQTDSLHWKLHFRTGWHVDTRLRFWTCICTYFYWNNIAFLQPDSRGQYKCF